MAKSPKRLSTKIRAAKRGTAKSSKGLTGSLEPTVRENTKQAKVIALLRRTGGATIADLAKATGWQSHTVRGMLSGALKKKLGLTIESEKPADGERVYRIS